MTSTIQVAGRTVEVVSLPTSPGMRTVEFNVYDLVAEVSSEFGGPSQTQEWMGGDKWSGVMTLPPLTGDQADDWSSFQMECRGIAKPFLLGDPLRTVAKGNLQGSLPVYDNATSGTNLAGQQTLYTKGWTANRALLLLRGSNVQIGYRLHRVLRNVSSDANGKAVLSIWPALREAAPADVSGVAQRLILANPRGLFRLGDNKRTWSATIPNITSLSFPVEEWR